MNLLETVPRLSSAEASTWVRDHWGFQPTKCELLDSERDQNFRICDDDRQSYVLKISNLLETREFLEGQHALLHHLASRVDFTPLPVASLQGASMIELDHVDNRHWTRLVTWLPGKPLSECRFLGPALMQDIASCAARIDHALKDFVHPAFDREFQWDLARGEQVVQARVGLIEDPKLRQWINGLLDQFRHHTKPTLTALPRSIIHNDFNDGNILVSSADNPYDTSVTGLVDFGDAVCSWTVGNLAVAMAYTVLKVPDPFPALQHMVRSYHAVSPLSESEVAALYGLVCLRLCMSVALAAEQSRANPDNEYLLVSQESIRRQLPKLAAHSFRFGEAFFRTALGWPATPEAEAVQAWWRRHQHTFAFPVNPRAPGIRPSVEQTKVLDLSIFSDLIPVEVDEICEPQMTRAVNQALQATAATVGIGRYLEPRLLYASSHFLGTNPGDECRTIHLGIDIFADQGTPVLATLSGTAVYVGAIEKPLDYGGLMILRHETDQGFSFYTLYGHLDPESLSAWQPGMPVTTGQVIATLGSAAVNGGWTPHLHFQCMLDLLDLGQDFPGVAYASQIDVWSGVSPDPNQLLGIAAECFPEPPPGKQQTLLARKQHIGPSLSIGYRQPIKMVRGWKQYLFDDSGRRYLDAYNNVPHVGHSHPAVAEAVCRQIRLLNTNTRYLHDTMQQLAARLTERMPAGLEMCYFVNSASEANELALRLARQSTGAKDMIVLDAAYHGHSTTLIDISPYKHDGPGGQGAPEWVHKVALPDIYRGRHKDPKRAATLYAAEVGDCIAALKPKLCGFICESCPSVGGQIILPAGYLQQVYASVRAAGGLCIADDVQTGYGRLGSHFFGFQSQDVVPDIVILGKPIGNGFPLAAVVTTRAIADAFHNGMEFFSTFGGNPVACAAGVAVLDVIREEGLQENAEQVGRFLLQGLRELQHESRWIGDVRGSGFFLGIELVQDRATQSPATGQADFVVNYCRDAGLLIGTDGPLHNVLKIRPPMCFDKANAGDLLMLLRKALQLL